MNDHHPVKAALLGLAVGDALGVPVEFSARGALERNPVTGMRAFGVHHQPAGTWSDDSSLAFCLAEMLCGEYDLQQLANRFVNWRDHGYWGAHGEVFDIGIATAGAIDLLRQGVEPTLAGGADEGSNGNGALMRILPLIFYLKGKSVAQRFETVQQVSSLTHRHIRSVLCCFVYTEYALELLAGQDKAAALSAMQQTVRSFLQTEAICPPQELDLLKPMLDNSAAQWQEIPVDAMPSSGYVLHTLQASLWSILTTDSYEEAVLKAVNLGEDTDTTGAVAGGLAGLIYGWQRIPEAWRSVLVRQGDIVKLAERLAQKQSS